MPRIVHAGGAATGAEIERTLVDAVRAEVSAVYESSFALDLLVEGGRCRGVLAADPAGQRTEVRAANVLVATGGYGQLFAVTTNPTEATGDGVAMAIRAGVAVADVEFEQFHPTALHHPVMPRPLLTEALRGHGALLRDSDGERFVDELLSRDKVSRAITARMIEQGVEHLWLDATGLDELRRPVPDDHRRAHEGRARPGRATGSRSRRPPTTAAAGILADLDGASSLPGPLGGGGGELQRRDGRQPPGLQLAARRHGVRPAGGRGDRSRRRRSRAPPGAMRSVLGGGDIGGRRLDAARRPTAPWSASREELQRTMTVNAGVLRSADSLAAAAAACAGEVAGDDLAPWELRNLATVGRLLCAAALAREESRGAHTRTDFDATRDDLRLRFIAGG